MTRLTLAENGGRIDNFALAVRTVTPGQWLAQVDASNLRTFRALCARGRHQEACEFLLSHLAKTEVTRTREHGPAPAWDDAVAAFECAVDRQQPAQLATVIRLFRAAAS